MKTKIPKRALEEAKRRLYAGGFRDGLDHVAIVSLAEPIRVLESFGCRVIFPRKINSYGKTAKEDGERLTAYEYQIEEIRLCSLLGMSARD